MSLRRRMALSIGTIMALLVIAGGTFTWSLATTNLHNSVDSLLDTEADAIQEISESVDFSRRTLDGQPLGQAIARLDELAIRIRLLPPEGTPNDRANAPYDAAAVQRARNTGVDQVDTITLDGRRHRVLTRALPRFTMQLATDVESMESGLASLRRGLLVWGVVGVVFGSLAGWLLARRLAKPVSDVAAAAAHLADHDELPEPIFAPRDDEVGELARSFNRLVQALALSRAQQQRLAADTGHELRTPLTSLRTRIEFLDQNPDLDPEDRQRVLHGTAAEMQTLSALVDELVELASIGPVDEPAGPLDLSALVEQIATQARTTTGRPIECHTSGTVIDARARLVRRAISSLVDNAHQHSPPGTPIQIHERSGRIEVWDEGPGIHGPDRAFVFQRFYRSPSTTSSGSGLGLAIVRHTAESHGGTVWIHDAPGGGAIVGFSLAPTDQSHGLATSEIDNDPAPDTPARHAPGTRSATVSSPATADRSTRK